MRLQKYIIISLLFHLTIIWILNNVLIYERDLRIFNVMLVSPHYEEEIAERVEKRRIKPIPRRRKPRHIDKDLRPETMFGGISAGREHGIEREGDKKSSEEIIRNSHAQRDSSTKGEVIIPPSALFDSEIINKYAKLNTPPKRGLSFDTGEFKHRGYLRMLKERIESVWKYPKEAARRGISGDLYIRFTINRDGSLGSVELLRTSGYRDLDEAALKALRDAEPYWPLPDDWEEDTLEITGHFIYIYGVAYVM